jgi:hypothetical protein
MTYIDSIVLAVVGLIATLAFARTVNLNRRLVRCECVLHGMYNEAER